LAARSIVEEDGIEEVTVMPHWIMELIWVVVLLSMAAILGNYMGRSQPETSRLYAVIMPIMGVPAGWLSWLFTGERSSFVRAVLFFTVQGISGAFGGRRKLREQATPNMDETGHVLTK
jgi:hypothetical protein